MHRISLKRVNFTQLLTSSSVTTWHLRHSCDQHSGLPHLEFPGRSRVWLSGGSLLHLPSPRDTGVIRTEASQSDGLCRGRGSDKEAARRIKSTLGWSLCVNLSRWSCDVTAAWITNYINVDDKTKERGLTQQEETGVESLHTCAEESAIFASQLRLLNLGKHSLRHTKTFDILSTKLRFQHVNFVEDLTQKHM